MKRHGATVVAEFSDTVKQALQDQANLIHAKLEAKDREP